MLDCAGSVRSVAVSETPSGRGAVSSRDIVGAWLVCLFLAAAAVGYSMFGDVIEWVTAEASAKLPAIFCAELRGPLTASAATPWRNRPID
jgi:hypothetical protein